MAFTAPSPKCSLKAKSWIPSSRQKLIHFGGQAGVIYVGRLVLSEVEGFELSTLLSKLG